MIKKDCLNVSVLEVLRCSHPLARSQPSDCYCIQLKSLSICCCFSPVITEEGAGDWAGGEILSYIPDQWRASYHQASCSSSIHMWPHSTSLLLFSRLFFVCFVHFHLVCSCIFTPEAGLLLQWYREYCFTLLPIPSAFIFKLAPCWEGGGSDRWRLQVIERSPTLHGFFVSQCILFTCGVYG